VPTKPKAVSSTVITGLMAEQAAGRITYHGPIDDPAGDRYAIIVHGRGRTWRAPAMAAWLAGWTLGGETADAPPPQEQPTLDAVRAVLIAPSLADRCRTAILAAMEAAEVDIMALAAATGRDPAAIRDALRYGNPGKLSVKMADTLMTATGHTWHVAPATAAGPETPTIGGIGRATTAESSGVRRMRLCAIAHEAQLVTWISPNRTGPAAPRRSTRGTCSCATAAGSRSPPPTSRRG
jgi:hypothetical protein